MVLNVHQCISHAVLFSNLNTLKMDRNVRKRTFGHVSPATIQISLRIRAVRSESSRTHFG